MTPSLQERATINFYSWEARARGYILNDSPVEIEPPYIPFAPVSSSSVDMYDDGRVPSLINQALKLLKKPKQKEEAPQEILPSVVERNNNRVVFSILFPKQTEIQANLIQELLHLLCYSKDSFSFEILAQQGSIQILFTANESDSFRFKSQLEAYFPTVIIKTLEWNAFNFDLDKPIAIADFGLENEFMLPTQSSHSYSIDPLTSIIATLSHLEDDEVGLFQVLFKGVTAPWANDALYASSDDKGRSFFEGHPDFISGVQEKVSSPLFGVVMRIAIQGKNQRQSKYIATELARNIRTVSESEYNNLIPLTNEGYDYEEHVKNVYYRSTNRLGFILNARELAHFVHYPNKTVVCEKLGPGNDKTKRANKTSNEGIYIGENIHNNESYPIYLDTESRLSHTHIVGATGVGKSTLIANMMLNDIEAGRGCAIFDPHGDICEDILCRIPEHRKEDVIIIDPSDSEFPLGFNLLEAKTEAEKIVLSSDMVSAFKRHATAWGDNMTAVLQNAINTILESTCGGTLIELKRLLIEDTFREVYLKNVDDPSLHYYWTHEYPMVRKRIAPLLTRIDTFLRPKLVRYMLAQKEGVDISYCLENNKIVLLKLSQGLIGEQNSYLLGSLFLAKFNQAALARQSKSKEERQTYMLFLDEFQNFITPSIERILSGARKYALGLTIAHQELGQIEDTKLLNSVVSNPKTRICFRLGDNDAKRLESGFSYFEQSDFQGLERGQAIIRVGSSQNDFNMQTSPLAEMNNNANKGKNYIIDNTRSLYSSSKQDIEALLLNQLPKISKQKKASVAKKIDSKKVSQEEEITIENTSTAEVNDLQKQQSELVKDDIKNKTPFETQKQQYLESQKEKERNRKHQSLQNYVKAIAEQLGFKSVIEKPLDNDVRIDVGLLKDKLKIAVEISVTNSADYEVRNIQKCINAKYDMVFMVSDNPNHLETIKTNALKSIPKKQHSKIHFIESKAFPEKLNELTAQERVVENRIKGYRVKTNYTSKPAQTDKQKSLSQMILNKLRKKK